MPPPSGPITLPVSCNKDCGAGCPLVADVAGGRLLRIRDNPGRPRGMRGCPRGYQMPRVVYAPYRLQRPLIATGPRGSGEFREASWEEALDLVAVRLEEVRGRHGPQAVVHLGGSGSCRGALHNTSLLAERFLALFGGFTATTGSYSAAAESFVAPYLFGCRDTGLDPATLRYSRLILLWGANPADTRFGCGLGTALRAARRRGVPVVVVDPRRSRSVVELGSEWLPVRPGTDTALMAAVLHVLLEEQLVNRSFIDRTSLGFPVLEAYVRGSNDGQPKDPAWAEGICGTPRERIRELARLYGRSRPAALIPGLSIQRTIGGEEAMRMAVALQVATGNLGQPGGSSGGSIWNRLPGPRCGRLPAAARLPAPANRGAGVPVYRWPDAVLEGTAGGYPSDIRLIYNLGGNYLASGSDVGKSLQAFRKVDFAVCHDYVLTPTARFCDVVLPATTFLEREDIVFPDINYLFSSAQAIAPVGQARNDYDVLWDLADRLGFGAAFSEGKSADAWLREFLDESEVPDPEEFRRSGIYAGAGQERMAFSEFAADPRAHPLPTPSGKVELASAAYAQLGFPAHPTYRGFRAPQGYPLLLVSPHARYRINSQYANDPWFLGREPQALWMNPADAAARGLREGQEAEVQSPEGKVRVPVYVTDAMMPGVVCLNAGAWPRIGAPDPIDAGGAPAVDRSGAANWLTSTVPTEPSQGSRTHSVAVEVRPAGSL